MENENEMWTSSNTLFSLLPEDIVPTLTLTKEDNDEILRFEQNGNIYLRGKLIENDIEVVEGFHDFLQAQGYVFGDTMIGKVNKLVRSESNDMKLGKKIRNLFK